MEIRTNLQVDRSALKVRPRHAAPERARAYPSGYLPQGIKPSPAASFKDQ